MTNIKYITRDEAEKIYGLPSRVPKDALSDRQHIVFAFMLSGKLVDATDIQNELRENGNPLAHKNSVVAFMRYLSSKVAPYGYVIEPMNPKRGRGARASYQMRDRAKNRFSFPAEVVE